MSISQAEGVIPKMEGETRMTGVKRDYRGNRKPAAPPKDMPRNAYTDMFEGFRDELDKHHDRRQKIIKVDRDVTALSKKIIFSLQRVGALNQPIPARIASENEKRIKEIKEMLTTIEDDVRGIRRQRYNLSCLEEFVEAVSFAHYLQYQTLISPEQAQALLEVDIPLSNLDYVFGVFDLTGEMMRFATAITALSGALPSDATGQRTILIDLQNVSSMLQIVPPLKVRGYNKKVDVMIEQVQKIERVGYGVRVRGNERPKGWMPDTNESSMPGMKDEPADGHAD